MAIGAGASSKASGFSNFCGAAIGVLGLAACAGSATDAAIVDTGVHRAPEVHPTIVEPVPATAVTTVLGNTGTAICSADQSARMVPPSPEACVALDPSAALATASQNVRGMLIGFGEALGFLQKSEVTSDTIEQVGPASESEPTPEEQTATPEEQVVDTTQSTSVNVAETVETEFFLEQYITSNDGCVLRLDIPSEQLCMDAEGNVDPDCAFTNANLAFTMWAVDDASQIYVQVHVGQLTPVEFRLFPNQIAAIIDVESALATVSSLADDATDLPEEASGDLEIQLHRAEDGDYTSSLSVRRPLNVRWTREDAFVNPEAAAPAELSVGQACPALTVETNVVEERLDVEWMMNDIAGAVPRAWLDDSCVATTEEPCEESLGSYYASIPATRVSASVQGDSEFALEQIAFAAAPYELGYRYEQNDQPLFLLDVDAEDEFAVRVTRHDAGLTFDFTSSVDLLASFQFEPLRSEMAEDTDEWLFDEEIHINLAGEMPALQVIETETDSMLHVMSGSLALYSSYLNQSHKATVGQCFVSNGVDADHPFGEIAISDCAPTE